MESISVEQQKDFILVQLAILSMVVAIDKGVSVIKGWRKPQVEVNTALAVDKRRLDAHDADIEDLRKGMRAICTGTKALLNHAIHDGNTDEMEDSLRGIDQYLISRR